MSCECSHEILYTKNRWESEDILLLKDFNPLAKLFQTIYYNQPLQNSYPAHFLNQMYHRIEALSLSSQVDIEEVEKIYSIVSIDDRFRAQAYEKVSIESQEGVLNFEIYRLAWLLFSTKIRNRYEKGAPLKFSAAKLDLFVFINVNQRILQIIHGRKQPFDLEQNEILSFFDTCKYLKMEFKQNFAEGFLSYIKHLQPTEENNFYLQKMFCQFHDRDPEIGLKILGTLGFSMRFEGMEEENLDLLCLDPKCPYLSEDWLEMIVQRYPLLKVDLSNLYSFNKDQLEMLQEVLCAVKTPLEYYVNVCFKYSCDRKNKKNFLRTLEPFFNNIAFFSWSEKDNDFTDLDQDKLIPLLKLGKNLKTLCLVKESKEISKDLVQTILEMQTLQNLYLYFPVKDQKALVLLNHPSIKQIGLNINFDDSFLKFPCNIPHLAVRKISRVDSVLPFFAKNSSLKSLSFIEARLRNKDFGEGWNQEKIKPNPFEDQELSRIKLMRKPQRSKKKSELPEDGPPRKKQKI